MKISVIYVLFALLILISPCSHAQFKWPNGAKAAVCLTYDDGLDCQPDVALP